MRTIRTTTNAELLLDGDLNLVFEESGQLRLLFDVKLTAMGDVEKCRILARGQYELQSDGKLKVVIDHCETSDNRDRTRVPARRSGPTAAIADSVERSCKCPRKKSIVAQHSFSNNCQTLRVPLPEFAGIDPVFTRQAAAPATAKDKLNRPGLKQKAAKGGDATAAKDEL